MTDASTSSACIYAPIPTRAWSRMQSSCTYMMADPSLQPGYDVRMYEDLAEAAQHQLKCNVLQHRGNSSQLTAAQRYAIVARGQWLTSRRSSWATQNTRGYTNPNIHALARVNKGANINAQTLQPTAEAVTCDPRADPIIIANGGTLVCGTRQNQCTGEIMDSTTPSRATICIPTTASNVPGRTRVLCWDGGRTWIPRRRITMPASGGGKFPTNYKHLVSALHTNNTNTNTNTTPNTNPNTNPTL